MSSEAATEQHRDNPDKGKGSISAEVPSQTELPAEVKNFIESIRPKVWGLLFDRAMAISQLTLQNSARFIPILSSIYTEFQLFTDSPLFYVSFNNTDNVKQASEITDFLALLNNQYLKSVNAAKEGEELNVGVRFENKEYLLNIRKNKDTDFSVQSDLALDVTVLNQQEHSQESRTKSKHDTLEVSDSTEKLNITSQTIAAINSIRSLSAEIFDRLSLVNGGEPVPSEDNLFAGLEPDLPKIKNFELLNRDAKSGYNLRIEFDNGQLAYLTKEEATGEPAEDDVKDKDSDNDTPHYNYTFKLPISLDKDLVITYMPRSDLDSLRRFSLAESEMSIQDFEIDSNDEKLFTDDVLKQTYDILDEYGNKNNSKKTNLKHQPFMVVEKRGQGRILNAIVVGDKVADTPVIQAAFRVNQIGKYATTQKYQLLSLGQGEQAHLSIKLGVYNIHFRYDPNSESLITITSKPYELNQKGITDLKVVLRQLGYEDEIAVGEGVTMVGEGVPLAVAKTEAKSVGTYKISLPILISKLAELNKKNKVLPADAFNLEPIALDGTNGVNGTTGIIIANTTANNGTIQEFVSIRTEKSVPDFDPQVELNAINQRIVSLFKEYGVMKNRWAFFGAGRTKEGWKRSNVLPYDFEIFGKSGARSRSGSRLGSTTGSKSEPTTGSESSSSSSSIDIFYVDSPLRGKSSKETNGRVFTLPDRAIDASLESYLNSDSFTIARVIKQNGQGSPLEGLTETMQSDLTIYYVFKIEGDSLKISISDNSEGRNDIQMAIKNDGEIDCVIAGTRLSDQSNGIPTETTINRISFIGNSLRGVLNAKTNTLGSRNETSIKDNSLNTKEFVSFLLKQMFTTILFDASLD